MTEGKGLEYWLAHLGKAELPVLKQTARDLAALQEDEENMTVVAVTAVIARDPMMTVRLLRYLQGHKHRSQTTEVIQIEQALLMLGLGPFYRNLPTELVVEDMLKANVAALPPLLRVVHRSHRASQYAMDWAALLHDMHYEEVRTAALMHDIAEILMWCFAPEDMLKIKAMQQQDKSLRSAHVQQQVLGFSLVELQKELAMRWGLPKLLLSLMNDVSQYQEREHIVSLAINLARHSANGWDDAALPDDYLDIAALLHITSQEVKNMVCPVDGKMPLRH
ncbi:MAG: HDOD domain-containing protein [Gallionella sp.]|nr:HDOD domain-containing protein [Gallionella sp.]